MKLRISGLLAIAAFAVACLLGNGQSLAQNAYITNQGPEPFTASTVSVIDTATNTVTATIPVGPASIGVAASPDGSTVYVTNLGNNSVSVIDTATNTVTATIFVASGPVGVAVTPDGSKVYVANLGNNSVSVIDTASNTVIATIPGGIHPYGVAVSPDGSKVYVANEGGSINLPPPPGTVSVIDTATNIVTATITVGPLNADAPGVAVTPGRQQGLCHE
jgi:YVTN family beta-propeller protein